MKYFYFYIVVAVCGTGGLAVYFFLSALVPVPDETYISLPNPVAVTGSSTTVIDQPWRRNASKQPVPEQPVLSDAAIKELTTGFYGLTEDENIYGIYYYERDQSLTVLLYQTPLNFSRALAERKLLTLFSKEELCAMDVIVMTNSFVDSRYAGGNLGLSFCADGVVLE